jgi:predicted metalloendopeptidase
VETRNALLYSLINDPHSLARFRILGTVGNSNEFAKAFSCKSKSTMNPSNKCYLW